MLSFVVGKWRPILRIVDNHNRAVGIEGSYEVHFNGTKISETHFNSEYTEVKISFSQELIERIDKINRMIELEIIKEVCNAQRSN